MNTDMPAGSKVAIYTRCSTTGQENSINDQKQSIDKIVNEHSLHVIRVYEDEGISGSTVEGRPGLMRLLRDAAAHQFDYVLIYDNSRLTRGGNSDFWHLYRELRGCRVRLYCCSRRMMVTERTGMSFSADATVSLEHNRNHARDITRSLIQNVTTRHCDPGRIPPYGYDRLRLDETGIAVEQIRYMPDGSKQVLDPVTMAVRTTAKKGEYHGKIKSHRVILTPSSEDRVQIIRHILHMSKTEGFTKIADFLNTKGTPCPSGGLWSASTIRSLVTNPAYYGAMVYNRTQKSQYYTIKDREVFEIDELDQNEVNFARKDSSQWIVQENAHVALISKEEFEEIQVAIQRRNRGHSRGPRSPQYTYLLSGSLFCERCGAPLHGHTSKSNKPKAGPTRYVFYTCSNARKHGSGQCARYSIQAKPVEAFAVDAIRSVLESAEAISLVEQGVEALIEERRPDVGKAETLERELSQLEKSKNALLQGLEPDQIQFIKGQINALMLKERQLQEQAREARTDTPLLDKKEVIAKATEYFRENVLGLNGGCRNAMREIIRALGVHIIYDPDIKEGVLRIIPFGQPLAE